MKQEDLDKANKVCKELTRFNDTLLYLESVKDDFYYFRCAKGMGYVDLEAYITLEIPIQNIKMPMIFDELKDISTIPELQIKYRSISDAENDVDVKYREYPLAELI